MLASSGSGSSRLEPHCSAANILRLTFAFCLRLYAPKLCPPWCSGTASLAAAFGGSFWREVDTLADSSKNIELLRLL